MSRYEALCAALTQEGEQMDTRHVTTIRQSELREKETEWQAAGWRPISFATFKSGGHSMVRVVMVKDEDQ